MKLSITTHAQRQIKKLPKSVQIIIVSKIRKLPNISLGNVEKLSGYKNFYRARVGTYRIVFIKSSDEIEIVLVAHRREVYNLLSKI